MKRIILPLLLLICLAIIIWSINFRSQNKAVTLPQGINKVTLELRRGSGTVSMNGTTTAISSGLTIEVGAILHINSDSQVLVIIEKETWLTLDEETTIQIDSLGQANQFALAAGRVSARIGRLLGKDESFKIKTPNSVAAVRGTIFGVEFYQGKTKVIVLQNKVLVQPIDPKSGQEISGLEEVVVTEAKKVELDVNNLPTIATPLIITNLTPVEERRWEAMTMEPPTIEPVIEIKNEVNNSLQDSETTSKKEEASQLKPLNYRADEAVLNERELIKKTEPLLSDKAKIIFVQSPNLILTPGQGLNFQLAEVSGRTRKILPGNDFEWAVLGDPGIGDIDSGGSFMAGPYGGSGEIQAVKTDGERIIFEIVLPIKVKGEAAPPDFEQG